MATDIYSWAEAMNEIDRLRVEVEEHARIQVSLSDALNEREKQIGRQAAHIQKLRDACYRYDVALDQIAKPPRPDGTYNLSREACEEIAKEALRLG